MQRRRPPRTHLHKEMLAARRDPQKSQRSEVEHALRILQEGKGEEVERLLLRQNEEPVPEDWQQKYKREGRLYWDQFYIEKTTNFFKDRHYLREELAEIMPPEVLVDPKAWVRPLDEQEAQSPRSALSRAQLVLLELGCAVGNGVLPLLRAVPALFAFACDLSPVAVELLRQKTEYRCGRCVAFASDISCGQAQQPTDVHEAVESQVPANAVDVATLIFVVSAIDPEMHAAVFQRVLSRLKPGGTLFFRDYGRGDLAQIRFASGHWMGGDTYVRGDGTLAHFFTVEGLRHCCEGVGFETLACEYKTAEIVNRARGMHMPRVWVQGKFRRPL
jgi:methyltransferase-like protein 6